MLIRGIAAGVLILLVLMTELVSADAEATANRKISESLTGNLVEWKRIDRWDGKLPQVSGGATPFISLSK